MNTNNLYDRSYHRGILTDFPQMFQLECFEISLSAAIFVFILGLVKN